MRTFSLYSTALFALSILCFSSCSSSKEYQTISYDSLSAKHKKIAVLPIILKGKEDKENDANYSKLMTKENDFIQNAVYHKLSSKTGKNKHEIKIVVEPINITNSKLKEKGIDIIHLEKLDDRELASILDVDAVLKTEITTGIWLHSTDDDVTKEMINIASSFVKNTEKYAILGFNQEAVFLQAEIIDLKKFASIWSYSKKRNLKVSDKNTELLSCLSDDIVSHFPYRK